MFLGSFKYNQFIHSMDMPFTYSAIEIQQKPNAEPFYVTQVSARELLKWADVPRKKADYMAGYQRQLSERYKKVKDFLELDQGNIVPGALLVAVNGGALDVSGNTNKKIEITYQPKNTGELIDETYTRFFNRLGDEEKAFVLNNTSDKINSEMEVENFDEIEEGQLPSSYLAELTQELKQARTDIDSLSDERRVAIEDYVKSVSKPGRILDGQHRVYGAKEVSEFDINFPVVLLPGMSESEQVFHFYVVNNKAKPLGKTELRSTISTSLTEAEIDELYERFHEAGVEAEEAKLTFRMHKHPQSPFNNLIDFGLEQSEGIIPENVAYQLVISFVKMHSRFRPLYENVDEWNQDPEFDYRLSFFYAFWDAIRDTYLDTWDNAIENGGGQIFQKVSLLQLQKLVLERLKPVNRVYVDQLGLDSLFADDENLKEAIKNTLEDLPEEFFRREWQEKGLDTKDGREFFKEQMEKAISGADIGRLKLFRKSD